MVAELGHVGARAVAGEKQGGSRYAPPPTLGANSGTALECANCLAAFGEAAGEALGAAVALRCGHHFDALCLSRCASAGRACCPTCRHPRELDLRVLEKRAAAFRAGASTASATFL